MLTVYSILCPSKLFDTCSNMLWLASARIFHSQQEVFYANQLLGSTAVPQCTWFLPWSLLYWWLSNSPQISDFTKCSSRYIHDSCVEQSHITMCTIWLEHTLWKCPVNNSRERDGEARQQVAKWQDNNAAEGALWYKHGRIKGLQSSLLVPIHQFSVVWGEFVQILHSEGSHWITVSNIG